MRTDQEILDQTNDLAREFYAFQGYEVEKGYRFDLAFHPQELLAWAMACKAQSMLTDTDLDDVMSSLDA